MRNQFVPIVKKPKRKKQRPPIPVPPDWWLRLRAFCKKKWAHDHKPGDAFDIYQFTGISRRTFSTARKGNKFTESTFSVLVDQIGCDTPDELLLVLSPPEGNVRPLSRTLSPPLPAENPKAFVLRTNEEMLSGTDFRELNLRGGRLEVVRCKIETESPYFRFGFKLLKENGRLFGDDSITTSDENRIVHIGRNNWDRRNIGVLAKDIFITRRLNGVRLKRNDEKMFSAGRRLSASVELRIDSNYIMTFSVNDIPYMNRPISPEICRRIVVAAWGDGEDYEVKVSDFSVNPASGS